MPERRGGAGDTGVADENVELAVPFMQRSPKPGDAVEIGQVERHQGGAAAVFADFVVEFLQPALRPRHRHDMRAGFCQRPRGGIADAARGAGDESDTGGEGKGHWSKLYRRPCESRDPYAVKAKRRKVSNGVRKTKAGGYGSPRSRGRRQS